MHLRRFVNTFLGREPVADAVQAKLEARNPAVVTLVSVVYSTAPKTFTGDAIYVTLTPSSAQPATTTNPPADDSSSVAAPISTPAAVPSPVSTALSSSVVSTPSRPTSSSDAPASIDHSSVGSATANLPGIPVASAAQPDPSPISESSGMSGGAKAGLVIGLLAFFALLGAGIFFLLKRRKRNPEHRQGLDDEKSYLTMGAKPTDPTPHPDSATKPFAPPVAIVAPAGIANTSSKNASSEKLAAIAQNDVQRFSYEENAPQLSLRAVSQFEPAMDGPLASDAAKLANLPSPSRLAETKSLAGLQGDKDTIANDPNNPFGIHAEKLSASPPNLIPLPPSQPATPGHTSPRPESTQFRSQDYKSKPAANEAGLIKNAAMAGGVGAAAIAAATAAAASNKPQASPNLSSNPAGGDNVHRVQLDFLPSMEDELDIRAGQLVRILHEYDDGWGVVPRTCLSKHTVKPRPHSPARQGEHGSNAWPSGPPPVAQPPPPLVSGSMLNSTTATPFTPSSRPLTPQARDRANGRL